MTEVPTQSMCYSTLASTVVVPTFLDLKVLYGCLSCFLLFVFLFLYSVPASFGNLLLWFLLKGAATTCHGNGSVMWQVMHVTLFII